MKIAYVMSRFPKITETFILYEMLALEKLGVEVEIFPLLRHRSGPHHPEAERMVARAHFTRFLSMRILAANWAAFRDDPGGYIGLWRDVLTGTWGSWNFFFGALAILPKAVFFAREMERRGVDHVHAHFANHPAVAAFVVGRLTDIPYSFTAHGSDLHVDRTMLARKVREAALVVAVSDYNRELILRECGVHAEEKVRVIHCGVDTDAFAPADEPPNARLAESNLERPFRLVCVASFERVKGHRFLTTALRLLNQQDVSFVCDLVGDGPEREAVERSIREADLGGRVRIHGALPRPAVISILGRADAAVLASHPTPSGKREGIPVALMEAMACGLPVVASDVSGIPELVEDGRTGLLVPPGAPRLLARSLEKLARNPKFARRLGHAGRDKVLRSFDQKRNARRLMIEIQRVGRAPSATPQTAPDGREADEACGDSRGTRPSPIRERSGGEERERMRRSPQGGVPDPAPAHHHRQG